MIASDAITPEQKRIYDKVLWRVMPFVTLSMVIGTIDRSNVGFAKLSMADDLQMSEAVFAFGSSLFYLGYILFEIPSALGMYKFGARLWLARIMFTWGLATLGLAFTSSTEMFYILRFLLGAAEAGLYPSLIFFIALWLPRSYHARGVGMLTIGSAVGNGTGALVSGPLLDLQGSLGLAGWQWIFLVTGAIPMIGTIVILRYMRDKIEQAQFLSEPEKSTLSSAVAAPQHPSHGAREVLRAMADWRIAGYGLGLTVILTALYGVIYWSPSVVASFGVTGTQNGLLVALPWALDAILLIVIPAVVPSRHNLLALAGMALLGCLAFAVSAFSDSNLLRYAMLLVGIPAVSITLSYFWTFPPRLFAGAAAAVGLAAINSLGNFGGLFGQNAMPAAAAIGGSSSAALVVPCACLGLVGLVAMGFHLRRAHPSTRHI